MKGTARSKVGTPWTVPVHPCMQGWAPLPGSSVGEPVLVEEESYENNFPRAPVRSAPSSLLFDEGGYAYERVGERQQQDLREWVLAQNLTWALHVVWTPRGYARGFWQQELVMTNALGRERANLPSRTPPASKAAISKLKKFAWKTSAAVNNDTKCTICLEAFENRRLCVELPCGHRFHSRCATKWLRRKCTCPICRFELPTDTGTSARRKVESVRVTELGRDQNHNY